MDIRTEIKSQSTLIVIELLKFNGSQIKMVVKHKKLGYLKYGNTDSCITCVVSVRQRFILERSASRFRSEFYLKRWFKTL